MPNEVPINKLRFKRTNPLKRRSKSPEIETSRSSSSPSSPLSKPLNNQSNKSKQFTYQEWGPSINGYKFVTDSKNSKEGLYYKQRKYDEMTGLNNEGYLWSYLNIPEYVPLKKHDQFDKTSVFQGYTYFNYYEDWEIIKRKSSREIIFPLINENDELNISNVEEFFQTSQGDIKEIIKTERIKWHPDKMIQTLGLYNVNDTNSFELIDKITKTFQIINQLWESYK